MHEIVQHLVWVRSRISDLREFLLESEIGADAILEISGELEILIEEEDEYRLLGASLGLAVDDLLREAEAEASVD